MKYITSLLLILINVQLSNAQVRVGVQAGITVSNQSNNAITFNVTGQNLSGYHAEITTYYVTPIKQLEAHFKLGLINKGAKILDRNRNITTDSAPLYLQLSLCPVYKMLLEDKLEIYVGLGPYLARGISGRVFTDNMGSKSSVPILYGNNPDIHQYKKTEYGADFIAGFVVNNKVTFSINYDISISDISVFGDENQVGNFEGTHMVFSLAVGYLFGKRENK